MSAGGATPSPVTFGLLHGVLANPLGQAALSAAASTPTGGSGAASTTATAAPSSAATTTTAAGAAAPEPPVNEPGGINYAAETGDLALMKRLVEEEGADVNDPDDDGNVPLHWACFKGHLEVVRYLISKNATIHVPNIDESQPPLHWAVIHGDARIVSLLVDGEHADLRTGDARGYNCLHHAAMYGHELLCFYFLRRGIAVDSTDGAGHNALQWAAFMNHPSVVRLLLREGADLHHRCEQGRTAVHWAASKGNGRIIELLRAHGANVAAKDSSGRTAAEIARDKNNPNAAALLDTMVQDGPVKSVAELDKYFHLWFALPMLLVPLAFAILSFLRWWLWPFAFFAAFGVARHFLKPLFPGLEFYRNPIHMGAFWASYGLSVLCFLAKVMYVLSPLNIIMFTLANAAFAAMFVTTALSDPGYLAPQIEDGEMLKKLMNAEFPDAQLCTTCMIARPLRSKHCKQCDRCVVRMDHHCYWLNGCVGANNHVMFLGLLVLICVLHLWFFWTCGIYLAVSDNAYVWPSWSLLLHLPRYASTEPLVFFLLLYHLLNLGWEGHVLYQQLGDVSSNMTLNERFNRTRYHYLRDAMGRFWNPFDRGLRSNWRQFFAMTPAMWSNIYDLNNPIP